MRKSEVQGKPSGGEGGSGSPGTYYLPMRVEDICQESGIKGVYQDIVKRTVKTSQFKSDSKAGFSRFDTNGDGVLDRQEVTQMLKLVNEHIDRRYRVKVRAGCLGFRHGR